MAPMHTFSILFLCGPGHAAVGSYFGNVHSRQTPTNPHSMDAFCLLGHYTGTGLTRFFNFEPCSIQELATSGLERVQRR
ncbi:hypothetical protein BJ741DRAFT_610319 [Chytriomyces cf. hyalinus JEL632]|nr:hypothetical protein BJ741DRAFT_610319 [Chytriomyces cf. hyalinus JEL632]